LEIVQLSNGDIVLKRADEEGDPLISICFSSESKSYIGEASIDVAKAMFQAGIEAAANIQENLLEEEPAKEDDAEAERKHLLH
jgi:hypothetical protein